MKTAEYYKKNPTAKAKRMAYQKEYNKRPEQIKKRIELNKINRDRGTYGNGDGKDASHTKHGIVMKKASINRGAKDMPGDRRARPMKSAASSEYVYNLLKRK
jgi:hypothetical protein